MQSPNTHIHRMNWGAFDLNLLTVFDAVMEERNVTRAGQKLGLSQPAASHALNRLRHMLKDELFVRAPEGMVPTPRAEELARPLRQALNALHLAVEPHAFDPALAERRFTIAVSNYVAIVVAAPLVRAAAAAAPRVRLDLPSSVALSVNDLLDRGELDLAIGTFPTPGERFGRTRLLTVKFVLMMRAGHPAAAQPLTPEAIAALPFIEFTTSVTDTGFLDDWLAGHGLVNGHRSFRRSGRLKFPGLASGVWAR